MRFNMIILLRFNTDIYIYKQLKLRLEFNTPGS